MKRYLLMLSGFVLLFAFSALAQNNCVAIRAIAQEHLLDLSSPDWQGGYPGAPWVGPVQLIFGDKEVLVGKLSENDGTAGPSKGVGQDRGGFFFFDFGLDGTFMMQSDNSVFPFHPQFTSIAGTGTFRAQGLVNGGTGRFANATGNLTTDGVFLAWNVDQFPPSGRFNNTITGRLCGVAPESE
jgi:hypothetical protein